MGKDKKSKKAEKAERKAAKAKDAAAKARADDAVEVSSWADLLRVEIGGGPIEAARAAAELLARAFAVPGET